MTYKIKNWQKHQHFKDRRPPWVKLYRDLLDDPDWHDLNSDDAKLLVGLWLVASEDPSMNGCLPDIKRLAFRMRINEKQLKQSLTRLSNWVIQDDIKLISERYQDDKPETETETEIENRGRDISSSADADLTIMFEQFWNAYPKKTGKGSALKSWQKLKAGKPLLDKMLNALKWQTKSIQWMRDSGRYVPNPATYLNQERWLDEPPMIQNSNLSEIGQRGVANMQRWLEQDGFSEDQIIGGVK